MNTLTKIFSVLFVAVLMSCGSGKNSSTSTNSQNNNANMNSKPYDSNRDNDINVRKDDNSVKKSNIDKISDKTSYQLSDYDNERNQGMYSDLGMTEDQIKRYETKSRTTMDTWKTNNAQRSMNMRDRMDHENKTMKGVLDQSQYSQYQKWVIDNPYKK